MNIYIYIELDYEDLNSSSYNEVRYEITVKLYI